MLSLLKRRCGRSKYDPRHPHGMVKEEQGRGSVPQTRPASPFTFTAARKKDARSIDNRCSWHLPFSADLLRLCAFLAPDVIPEAILTTGASELGPILASVGADAYLLNEAIERLRAYSLIARDPQAERLPF